jgi:hypothetical protein
VQSLILVSAVSSFVEGYHHARGAMTADGCDDVAEPSEGYLESMSGLQHEKRIVRYIIMRDIPAFDPQCLRRRSERCTIDRRCPKTDCLHSEKKSRQFCPIDPVIARKLAR